MYSDELRFSYTQGLPTLTSGEKLYIFEFKKKITLIYGLQLKLGSITQLEFRESTIKNFLNPETSQNETSF